jgi:RepB DNA-primase from phage plasmid
MQQLDYQRSMRTAQDFLTRCFALGESIALFLRHDTAASATQRIVLIERALAPRYLGWLAHENSTGANIYVAANPVRSGSKKRTKESIATVRHLYIDIDTDGEARLAALRASVAVPTPNVVLSTSPGKYQVLWRVDGFDFERQESALKLLAVTFGGDSACTDCSRVVRVPGFQNCKYDAAHVVTVQYLSDCIYSPEDFHLDISAAEAAISTDGKAQRKHPGKHTHSEHDWAWVSHELAEGKDAVNLTRALASQRSDKPNPLYYARRTVDVASARLWLLDGVRIEDVITMLEVRRRFEIPSTLCSARAREIALTAQRMIARRKTA